ncbi:MAG: 50S ribosomal protein L23 [Leptospiraceae bacterium]|nr:50S ribosomal protein L23 [Leptospiraceae bacterium]
MDLQNVIIAPLITEKTEEIKEPRKDQNRYTLKVHTAANKELIRQALYKLYNVNAIKVNTIIVPGKMRRFRQDRIKLPKWKKAIVTLAPGQSIDFGKAG